MAMRLDKYLAEAGAGTRTEVKKQIQKGIIRVNGLVVKDSSFKLDEEHDLVEQNGIPVRYARYEYYMLNKPQGVISASKADLRNPDTLCVVDLIENRIRDDLFPVGRLDKDTEGLLIITNDGALAHGLLSPKRRIDKTYYAELDGALEEKTAQRLMAGVDIGDPDPTLPCRIEILTERSCRITVQEGRFHEVKRIFLTAGLTVTFLKRVSMGPLLLDPELDAGEYRALTDSEIEQLRHADGRQQSDDKLQNHNVNACVHI